MGMEPTELHNGDSLVLVTEVVDRATGCFVAPEAIIPCPATIEAVCPKDGSRCEALTAKMKPRRKKLPKQGQETWVPLRKVLGTARIPETVAEVVQQCIDAMTLSGDIAEANKWQVLEYVCAEYLAGIQQPEPEKQS